MAVGQRPSSWARRPPSPGSSPALWRSARAIIRRATFSRSWRAWVWWWPGSLRFRPTRTSMPFEWFACSSCPSPSGGRPWPGNCSWLEAGAAEPPERSHRPRGPTMPADMAARDRVRLFAVALAVLVFCALHAWRGFWVSDFWEHAAVVRELAVRPFSPRHPILAVDATHAFFSPYHLPIALAARPTAASPISALAIAGLVNIVLLVLALRRFLVRLLPEGAAATPYALVFILLLWGRDAWWWSGFLHIDFLPFVVPYPSTFAAAGMFLGLS